MTMRSADESQIHHEEVTTEEEGRTKLNLLPSAKYSAAGLHQYRWQRTPYTAPSMDLSAQTMAPPPISVDEYVHLGCCSVRP